MSILEAVVLGLVQGITEFLPSSSSGHLVVIPDLLGWQEQSLLFDVVVHLGSLAAIVLMLWKDLPKLFGKGKNHGRAEWVKLLVSAVPILLAGYTLEMILGEGLRVPLIVAISLIFWGVVLWFVDNAATKNKMAAGHVPFKTAMLMGAAQVLALVPGTSRSGITMIAGMDRGLTRTDASKFSFLMAIPVIAAAGSYKLIDAVSTGAGESWGILFVGAFASFAAGVVAIKLLLEIVKRTSFKWFAGYRILLGIVLIIWLVV
jgi:undecaprenyl-diphosphatase